MTPGSTLETKCFVSAASVGVPGIRAHAWNKGHRRVRCSVLRTPFMFLMPQSLHGESLGLT